MRWIRENRLAYIVSLLAVFTMVAGFSMTGDEFFTTTLSLPEVEDALYEPGYHFPDQAGEPALLNKADDPDFSISRFAYQRFFDLYGIAGFGNASCFSLLQSHSTENSFDNKKAIQIKLRI